MRASLVVLALIWAGCSFPTDGVALQGDPPDAEVAPPDACVAGTETCDGLDNDCDGTTDEGVSSGLPCDGDDADLCMDDTMICDETGAEVCALGEDNVELCNEIDDDCDGTPDEGFVLDTDCDGGDGDACEEGRTVCAPGGAGTTCNDTTDTIVETCNQLDDDCDGTPDDGFDLTTDEAHCGACNNPCTNPNGTTSCDTVCVPVCNNGAALCDPDPDNGCELVNTNPACTAATAVDADVNGDVNGESATFQGTTERFFRIRFTESSSSGSQDPITGRITLTSGAGTDFDLFVYCLGAGGTTATLCGASPLGASDDVVEVGRTDVASGVDRTFDVIAEVRYDPTTPSTTCAQWTLGILGDPSPTPSNRCAD